MDCPGGNAGHPHRSEIAMPETLTKQQRSRIMAAVKSRNTKPEIVVRRLVHRLGYRFRLHGRDLPGTPDIVLPRLRKVINVHGCFWHMHTCCHARRAPVNNREYWRRKRFRSATRDKKSGEMLRRAGWTLLIVWECELKQPNRLAARIRRFLRSESPHRTVA